MTYGDEIRRKLIHLSSLVFPLVYWATSREFMLSALVPLVVVAIVTELFRRHHCGFHDFIDRWLGRVIRQAEARTFTGATYVMFAALITIAIIPEPAIAITALLFLSVSDAAASLVGRRFGTIRFLGKSLAGSSAFFVSAVALGLLPLHETPGVALVGALAGTLIEALPIRLGTYKLDDNLTIPLVSGGAMVLAQALVY